MRVRNYLLNYYVFFIKARVKMSQDDEIVETSGSSLKEFLRDGVLLVIPVVIIVILIFSFF